MCNPSLCKLHLVIIFLSVLICNYTASPETFGETKKLIIDPEHSYYFLDDDHHIYLTGISDRALFYIWKNDKGFSWIKYLDEIASYGINYVRQDVFSWSSLSTPSSYPAQFSNPAWPFARTGPGAAIDGKPKFDLTKFNQDYFDRRIKPFLNEAAKRGIYVELTLFDRISHRAFMDSVYADRNNINGLDLKPGDEDSEYVLKNPYLLAIQEHYVDKVLEETHQFGNIIYEIANETGGKLWVAHFVDYIHNHPKYPSKLVSAGEQSTSYDPVHGKNDIVIKHRGSGGPYARNEDLYNHHNRLIAYRNSKPIIHNEYFLFVNRSTDDLNFVRKMMWSDFTAGGHSNFYDFTFWRGTGRKIGEGNPSRTPPQEIMNGAKYLMKFLKDSDARFWLTKPCDDLARIEHISDDKEHYIFTLATPGVEYVCYLLGDGPIDVSLTLEEGDYSCRWYNPQSGEWSGEILHVESSGGKRISLTSPAYKQDLVLYVSNDRRYVP